jgi:hypothetical protein
MILPVLLAFQQAITQGPAPVQATTPATRDTVGYWQQRADYRITARLNEQAQRLEAFGVLNYVNRSPDTLRVLYLHQHLNAFRPGSKWSQADAREGRVRFQNLREPDYAYERFTEDPIVGGVAVRPEYPGAPDSTVVRLALPQPLPPGDSVEVRFAWHARPSTTARRQGRRGRHWDFAQWYPKVAVYDRGGWEPNALQPAGEFYGEFGTFDVTLTLAQDQVIGTTGVVVNGDPGWERARRGGTITLQPNAYGPEAPVAASATEAGEKVVRIVARDVHEFAWSVSPDYRYEGGVYVRPASPSGEPWSRFRTWDTVAVHVLYRAGDERDWGNGQAVQRTINAIGWLERVYGPYAYPQMTNLHRIDGGGTEFPMMMMNGSASQGLILHEGGHIFSFGILANNEWRSGWMDEGLTSYQTSWAQGLTRTDRARNGAGVALPIVLREPPKPSGYAGLALRPTSGPDAESMSQWQMAVQGIAQPIGTRADAFRDFGTYNNMIYSRAEMMYGALRDAIGDTAFSAFLQDYYARWGLRHVDEVAMRASAERASGKDLGWFFTQWVHQVGLVDYALTGSSSRRDGNEWVTRARIVRRGDYRHPMPVGARTASGWTIARGDARQDKQWVEIRTSEKPVEVRLDPLRTTEDWYRPNDEREGWWIFKGPRGPKYVFDWPLLDQASADRTVVALSPLAWYAEDPGLAIGFRMRGNYRGLTNRIDAGGAYYLDRDVRIERCRWFGLTCASDDALGAAYQYFFRFENPGVGGQPAMGLHGAYAELDGVQYAELGKRFERRRYFFAPSSRSNFDVALRFTRPFASGYVDPVRWQGVDVLDARVAWTSSPPPRADVFRLTRSVEATAGIQGKSPSKPGLSGNVFATVTFDLSLLKRGTDDKATSFLRLWGVTSLDDVPRERLPALGARGATDLFFNHFVRPRGGLLSEEHVPFVVPGGAGMRGYLPYLPLDDAVSANAEQAWKLRGFGARKRLGLFGTVFADATWLDPMHRTIDEAPFDWLADAGVGLALRGPLFDRDVRLRLDVPVYLNEPSLAIGRQSRDKQAMFRLSFAASELW